MVQNAGKLDPESLVVRMVTELEANPAAQPLLLRVLLTNEFRGIPVRLDRMEADVAEMKIDVRRLKTDVSELKTDVSQLKVDVSQLKIDVSELKTDVSRLKIDVSELKTDVSRLKIDVSELKTDVSRLKIDVSELKTDVSQLKIDVSELKTDVSQLKIDVSRLKIDVADLKGDNLEFKLPQRIRPFLSQKLALRGARIMQSAISLDQGEELADAVERAADADVITDAEETRLVGTDLILRARRKRDRSTVWVAVEASHTVDRYDIDRARESAELLRRVCGADSVAAAVGYGVRTDEQRRAEELGVEVWVVDRRAA